MTLEQARILEVDLRTMAHRVLTEAREELERTGRLTPVFVVQQNDGDFLRFELRDKAGELMNWGDAKDAIFGFVRDYVREKQAVGCIIVSEAWMTRTTEQGAQLGKDEFLRLYRAQSIEELVKRGLATRIEAIIVSAQSAESVLQLTQPFEREERLQLVTFGTLETQELPQSGFAGRQKMFGDLRAENLR